jgi:AcrR family transcriptional regulator
VNIAAPFRCSSVADRKFASYDSYCLLALADGHSMARAIPTNPRKSASQERSRATVQALLDATARVLTREGYDRASTNRIAATAGVSVGSLYQYFPNKEALVAALVARHNREMLDLLREALKEVASLDLATAIAKLVRAAVDAHRVDPALHRVLDEQVPRMGQLAKIEALQGETFQLVRSYLEERRNEISVRDLDSTTSILVTTVEALTHQFVIHRSNAPERDRDRFIDEVTRLVVGYLQPGRR